MWVIDNLPDLEMINPILNRAGTVKLLVTTRDSRRHLLHPHVGFLQVGVLDPDPAIELLRSRRNDVAAGNPAMTEIVKRVGRLPLALEAWRQDWQSPDNLLRRYWRS